MEKIGILIDLKGDELKKTNFGMITLARSDARELYALVLNGKAEDYKAQLQQYGIAKIINITSPHGPIDWNPAKWAGAVIAAMEAHGITCAPKNVYFYKDFKYDRLDDAVRYAEIDASRIQKTGGRS